MAKLPLRPPLTADNRFVRPCPLQLPQRLHPAALNHTVFHL